MCSGANWDCGDTSPIAPFLVGTAYLSRGVTPPRVSLRIIQRGGDPHHYEIVPRPGANLTLGQFVNACTSIMCKLDTGRKKVMSSFALLLPRDFDDYEWA